jgi:hypothetical protein
MLGLITSPKFFPIRLIVLDILAAMNCCLTKDIGRLIYWLCAAGLTFAVTFMMK